MSAAISKFSSLYDGDTLRIFLLIFLYILQGIPLGIGSSIPYLLQARKVMSQRIVTLNKSCM